MQTAYGFLPTKTKKVFLHLKFVRNKRYPEMEHCGIVNRKRFGPEGCNAQCSPHLFVNRRS